MKKHFVIACLLFSKLVFAENSVHFFSFGDWGSGTQDQKNVALETGKICHKYHCDFGLFLGDNFYPAGVSSTQDPYWQSRYRDLYHDLKIPLYAALGNHDWKGNPQAEIDFTKDDPYWRMPDYQYSFRYPEKESLLQVFVIDSDHSDHQAQEWLKEAIKKSKATWKILAFHHPLLNNGTEHPSDEKKLWPHLRPIVCGKIDLFLAGHEHIFSHLKGKLDECPVEQMVIGTGGKELYKVGKTPEGASVLYSESQYGLGFFTLSQKKMTLDFYHADGKKAYSEIFKK